MAKVGFQEPPCHWRRQTGSQMSVRLCMSRAGKIAVVVSVICCVGFTVLFSHRTDLWQLLTLPLIPCFLVAIITSVVCIFSQWRQCRWRSVLPFAFCVLSVFVSIVLVYLIREAMLVWSFPSYEAVVRQMESGSIPVGTKLSRIPQAEPMARLAYRVFAQKDTNGVLTVEFWTEGGFPVKHSGYLYVSSGVIETGARWRWTMRHKVRSKWFYFSD